MLKIVVVLIGILLAVPGAVMIINGLKHCIAMKKSRKVTAKIVGFEKEVSGYSQNYSRSHRVSICAFTNITMTERSKDIQILWRPQCSRSWEQR